jgi:hypothetical protein
MRWLRWSCLALAVVGAAPALAQDDPDDDFEFDDADDPPPAPKPASPPADEEDDLLDDEEVPIDDPETTPGDPGFLDPEDDEVDDATLLQAPGVDTLEIYREQEKAVRGMAADEETMAWEAYLQTWPNSVYRTVIEDRIEALLTQSFQMRIDSPDDGSQDADQQELLFVQPLGMTNVNPRTAVQVGLDFGFPTYIGLNADFEYAFKRNISAHVGLAGRYAGWGLDIGSRWAFVKSTKLQFVGTLVADIGVSFSQRVSQSLEGGGDQNTAYFLARPQLAFGKIIGPVQILLTAGAEIGSRKNQGVAILGGLHVGARVAQPVGVFVETDVYVRNVGREAGVFTFDVLTFGLKFYPMAKKKGDPMEIGMGGHLPVATQYLQYYLGAVGAQGTYYLDL